MPLLQTWCACRSSAAAANSLAVVLDIKLSTITQTLHGWKHRTLMAARSHALVQAASESGLWLSAAQQSTLRLLLLQDTKRCTSCKDFKPRDHFNKDKTRGDGLACTCRPCANRNTKNWHHKHRQQVSAPLPPTTAKALCVHRCDGHAVGLCCCTSFIASTCRVSHRADVTLRNPLFAGTMTMLVGQTHLATGAEQGQV